MFPISLYGDFLDTTSDERIALGMCCHVADYHAQKAAGILRPDSCIKR